MDGDGDVAVANGGDSGDQVSAVYLNDGDAGFYAGGGSCTNPLDPFPVDQVRCLGELGHDTRDIALADVDGDGALDIAVGNDGEDAVYFNDEPVSLNLNAGADSVDASAGADSVDATQADYSGMSHRFGGGKTAAAAMERAHGVLQARAAGIQDAELRELYLGNVWFNRAVVEAWEAEAEVR